MPCPSVASGAIDAFSTRCQGNTDNIARPSSTLKTEIALQLFRLLMGSDGGMPLAHIDNEDLERYLLGQISSDKLSDVEPHLVGCGSCASRLSTAAGFAFRLFKLANRYIDNYAGNEKRREHRIPTDEPGQMQIFSPFSIETIPIQIRDISRNGLKVHTPRLAERGTIVQVIFKGAIILGEVRYCVADGTEFAAGIQIQDVIPRR